MSPKVRCIYNATKKIYEIHSVNGDHITKGGSYEETDFKFIDGTRSQLLHDAHGGVCREAGVAEEDQELCLRDGTEKIFYNCVSSSEEVSEHLKELYDYIRTGRAGGALTRKIEEAVGRARKNEEWRSEYMKELLHDDDVREEGREEGRNLLLALISKMTAGGDGDKIVQLENPEVLETMQRKYGLVLQPCKK